MKQHIDKSHEHYRRTGDSCNHPEDDGAENDGAKPSKPLRGSR
ncbi:hypothetical protein FBZ81_103303 [Azospirillum brasilense]|nr:hypothetical protein OH82_00384 [Azospirillum brasilense]TWB85035.1 hypothetical protein FBZ81_103303 [Azospirillum brasilense]